MLIKKLKIANFYSFKNEVIDFDNYSGIVQIKGKNKDAGGSNGSGKSSIFEAVIFSIFGKTIRKSTEEALVNCEEKSKLQTEVDIYKPGYGDIKIIRTKKPSSIEFTINGVSQTQENMAKTQERIESVLGIDYKTYIAAFVFGQHVPLDFLSATPDEKRGIVRSFLNLEDIFGLRDNIRSLKSLESNKIKVCDTLLKEYSDRRKALELKRLESFEKVVLTETLDDVSDRESRKRILTSELSQYKKDIGLATNKIAQLDKILEKGAHQDIIKCGECGSLTHKAVTYNDIQEYGVEYKNIKSELLLLEKGLNKRLDELEDLNKKITLKEFIILKEKENLQNNQKIIRDELASVIKSIRLKEKEKAEASINYEVLRFWERGLSEQGLIKYFVKNILHVLNSKTNEYISILTNNQFILQFDDQLNETITNNGREIKFISLSGGEKRKINLAVMLALQNVLRQISKVKSNLIFFDEITENIDEEGAYSIHTLLSRVKEENATLFLITHNDYLKKRLDSGQDITIIKSRGESTIQKKRK